MQSFVQDDDYWTSILQSELRELSGSAGRSPGEAVITSMGSISAPFVDTTRSCLLYTSPSPRD